MASTWPCSLNRARNSPAASRSAAGRSPRGHVACASSNSWTGRIPTVSGLSMVAMCSLRLDSRLAYRRGAGAGIVHVGAEPVNRAAQSVVERRGRLETEPVPSARGVESAARLAVGLPLIPEQRAGESGERGNPLRELPDRDLLAGPHVDRLRAVVPLRGARDRLGAVLDVEELPRRTTGAPARDRLRAGEAR